MQCPVHPEVELRAETDSNRYVFTGFCLKCLKHHPRCTSVHYMEMCNQVLGHEGPHGDPSKKRLMWVPFDPHAVSLSGQ